MCWPFTDAQDAQDAQWSAAARMVVAQTAARLIHVSLRSRAAER